MLNKICVVKTFLDLLVHWFLRNNYNYKQVFYRLLVLNLKPSSIKYGQYLNTTSYQFKIHAYSRFTKLWRSFNNLRYNNIEYGYGISTFNYFFRYMSRLGIEVGETEMIVYACTLEDKKFVMTNGNMQCVKQVKFPNLKITK